MKTLNSYLLSKNISIINGYVPDEENNALFVGHTGVAINTNDGVIFIEKYGFELPYQITKFKSIGERMMEGLGNGIKNAASKVVDKAKGVVNDAIDGAKKLLGIKSPSRVFKKIGMYVRVYGCVIKS